MKIKKMEEIKEVKELAERKARALVKLTLEDKKLLGLI